jgi:hypothetical protein
MNDTKILTGGALFILVMCLCLLVNTGRPIIYGGADQKVIHVTAAGDYAALTPARNVLDGVAAAKPDFHIALGDFAYKDVSIEKEWCNFVRTHLGTVPVELISGNHESDDNHDGDVDYFLQCLPHQVGEIHGDYAKQYYFDYPRQQPIARFIFITPNLKFDFDGPREYKSGTVYSEWLNSAIMDARQANIPWIIVGMHEVCIASGMKGCQVGEKLTNYLIDQKVDLVLQAHEHAYERTYLLTCVKPTHGIETKCVDKNGDETGYVKGNGTIFAIVGTGGAPLHNLMPNSEPAGYFSKISGKNINPTYGFLDLVIDKDHLKGSFVATPATPNAFTDSFSIVR